MEPTNPPPPPPPPGEDDKVTSKAQARRRLRLPRAAAAVVPVLLFLFLLAAPADRAAAHPGHGTSPNSPVTFPDSNLESAIRVSSDNQDENAATIKMRMRA